MAVSTDPLTLLAARTNRLLGQEFATTGRKVFHFCEVADFPLDVEVDDRNLVEALMRLDNVGAIRLLGVVKQDNFHTYWEGPLSDFPKYFSPGDDGIPLGDGRIGELYIKIELTDVRTDEIEEFQGTSKKKILYPSE